MVEQGRTKVFFMSCKSTIFHVFLWKNEKYMKKKSIYKTSTNFERPSYTKKIVYLTTLYSVHPVYIISDFFAYDRSQNLVESGKFDFFFMYLCFFPQN